jgi:non-haem Fe2+, alpha-ketoglutarate-dependent halogenase
MPKVLTDAQIRAFETQGFLSPVRVMTTERARSYRERFESLEARHAADIKKMKTKSHLLCPWVLEIAEDPHVLDVFEDLIGPDLRCWSMAWRVKKADGQTFAGWHQDSAYGAAVPVVLGALALSDCGTDQGCLRGIPGRTRGASSSTRRATIRGASWRAGNTSPMRSMNPRPSTSR